MQMFTVEALTKNKKLEGVTLVAGKDRLNNVITNVNVIDNPDTYDWLSSGDFVLSTGYIYKDDPDMQIRLIKELADINCAGIGIKIMRYFNEIPQRMIEAADAHRLPVVRIPYHYSLAQISNVINNEMLRREDSLLQKSMQIHTILTRCSLQGGDLNSIAGAVVGLVGNPLLILDSKWRLLAYEEHPENPEALAKHLTLTKRERVLPPELIQDIPHELHQFTKPIKRRFPDEHGSVVCRILPVAADKCIYGYLVVWETVNKMTNIDCIALESAATAVALERIKARQIEEIKHHLRQDFFDDLLSGKIESVNAVNNLAEIHNMDPGKAHICFVIKLGISGGDTLPETPTFARGDFASLKNKIINQIDSLAYNRKKNVVSIQRGNLIISFIKLRDAELSRKVDSSVSEFLDEIYASVRKCCPEYPLHMGVSKACRDFLEMRKAYMQAQEAIRLSAEVGQKRKVCFYEDLMVYHLLDGAVNADHLQEFYKFTVGYLAAFDKDNGTNLITTLEQYFLCNGNISTAAKKMFLHRNTVIYRIEKIKSILQSDLKDPEELLELQIGLKIMKILG